MCGNLKTYKAIDRAILEIANIKEAANKVLTRKKAPQCHTETLPHHQRTGNEG